MIMKLPIDIMLDMLQYLNPNKLDDVAESAKWWRCIVNMMDRSEYIERWLRINMDYGDTSYTTIVKGNMERTLRNKWYFKLLVNNYMLLQYINERDKQYIWWDKRLYICVSHIDNINISSLDGIHTVDLYACGKISDLSSLSSVKRLNLSYCTNIRNVSSLYGIHSINLYGCSISDICSLKGVYSIKLSESMDDNLGDISSLGGVYSLELWDCKNISDVSGLGGVHSLFIINCYKLRDVGSLGSVHILNLSWCLEINDVSSLGSVHTLTIDSCLGVGNVNN